jgi:hypothetical protein
MQRSDVPRARAPRDSQPVHEAERRRDQCTGHSGHQHPVRDDGEHGVVRAEVNEIEDHAHG